MMIGRHSWRTYSANPETSPKNSVDMTAILTGSHRSAASRVVSQRLRSQRSAVKEVLEDYRAPWRAIGESVLHQNLVIHRRDGSHVRI